MNIQVKNRIGFIVVVICVYCTVISVLTMGNNYIEKSKYIEGYVKGYDKALDTVSKVINSHVKNDSSVAHLNLINSKQDTVAYYIYNKIIPKKKQK